MTFSSRSTYIPGQTRRSRSQPSNAESPISTMANDPPPPRNTRGQSTAVLAGVPRTRLSTRSSSMPSRLSSTSSKPASRARQLQQPKKKPRATSQCRSSPPPSPLRDPSLQVVASPLPFNMDISPEMLGALTAASSAAASNEPESFEDFASSLLNNPCLFGDENTTNLLNNYSVNSDEHEVRKGLVKSRFFYILSLHPNFRFLTELIDDPLNKKLNTKVPRFYVELRGVKTDTNNKILNYCMILFSQSFIKKDFQDQDLTDPLVFAQAQYEPNTVDMNLRCLFTVFKSKSIMFEKGDFNQRGDFPAYWKKVFELTKKLRPDYATKKKASSFDPLFRQKRRKAIDDGVFHPLTNYTHHTWMLLEELMCVNMLRGCQEPCMLTREDFIHGIMPPDSAYAGQRFYKLRSTHSGQKGNPISLRNQTVNNERNNNAYVPMIEPPRNAPDPLSLYNLLHRHLTVFLPTRFERYHPNNAQIFRRQASAKQIKVCSYSKALSLNLCHLFLTKTLPYFAIILRPSSCGV